MTWIVVLLLVVYAVKIYMKYAAEQKKQEKRRLGSFKPESSVETVVPVFPVLEEYMQTETNSEDTDSTKEIFSYENTSEYCLDGYVESESEKNALKWMGEKREGDTEIVKDVSNREDIPYIGRFSPESALVYDAIMHPKHEEV